MGDILTRLCEQGDAAAVLGELSGLEVYPRSIVSDGGAVLFLGRQGRKRRLGILTSASDDASAAGFDLNARSVRVGGQSLLLSLGEANHTNASALRARLPFTAAIRVGLHKSAGLGDRLGIATPGHIRAVRHAKGIVPVLAQQSIREMERTERTPDQVIDTATWGVFQEGWQAGYGADADHLKTPADIDVCVDAGFVMYTLDPREHVDNEAETDSLKVLAAKYEALPWDRLETTAGETQAAYVGKSWDLDPTHHLTIDKEHLLRAACKYGRALAHLAAMYRHLLSAIGDKPFELEISVDETETPTKPEEHLYIANELKRLGVEWVSLAPRYIGRFEKGVDYIGDLARFEEDFSWHVAIAKAMGPYKLSLHSGSDKFSIYPIAARIAGDLVHLKTAGTSYLEALRAIARVDPGLFREILRFAIANYERERVSYHVSGDLARVPAVDSLTDEHLGDVLDQFDARQVLHVTFGRVLTTKNDLGQYLFRDRLYDVLEGDEEAHYDALETHIAKHVLPFSD